MHARRPSPSACSAACIVLLAACRGGGGAARDGEADVHAPNGAPVELPEARPLVVRSGRVTRVDPGAWIRPPLGDDGQAGVIVLEGVSDVVLDLTGVSLRGTPEGTDLDLNEGFGIVLRDCDDVTIRGGRLGGYKVCIAAFDCRDLAIEDVEFDGWFGQRLLSTTVAENEADWLRPHENDAGEWMERYGAAIALNDCKGATIARCRGRHGQNGILLTRSDRCTLFDDDFSFLSGWGLALYRSSGNRVSHCVFDYCVRGYSHDVYWRGQDSAGILMFERCSDNVFVRCSATHGGDGVFLYGGNDTVEGRAFERGEMDAGGSDHNVWYACDFSFAVANSIEATFSSDNWAIQNRLDGAHQHGVWGGYSRRMVVLENHIAHVLGGGVSIEHGQDCVIEENVIEDCDIGVEVWWDADPELVGGPFGLHRDTRSSGHRVSRNRFDDNARDLEVTQSTGIVWRDNEIASTSGKLVLDQVAATDVAGEPVDARALLTGGDGRSPSGRVRESSLTSGSPIEPDGLARARAWIPPDLPGALDTSSAARGGREGLETIVMGDWGPWDFRSGEPRPAQRAPGGVFASVPWTAAWFAWTAGGGDDAGTDPRRSLARWRDLAREPAARGVVTAWTDPWGGSKPVRESVGRDRFGLIARATVEVARGGKHRLAVTSDDGVRVIVDGKTVLENWTWHGPTRDTAEIDLDAGTHAFVLEYFQIDGAVALSVDLERIGS